ncbi:MAG: pseudouridine-5'-phosphate glycosidase [Oscillochloridaceae bacterium]|nr:pseudouridine-5'-phosphate glycosidase [Chloroflexaceae bacterium]MDW8389118.1 pseudouridine-5'-phosphate glycosidase [Oscillochloridaceae bacterium]
MLRLSEEVATAVDEGRAVVALESTLISHGLPYPENLAIARALEAEVRAAGAVPATIGVVGGTPTVGLEEADLERFATRGAAVRKLSRRDLAACIAQGADGATTVAATMALAAAAGIAVFATGGIGGVHRDAARSWDVSADLIELARTPVLVVCAGAKAILDLPATLEYLETLGVPVVGYGVAEFPAFYSRSSGLPLPMRADRPEEVATLWTAQRLHSAVAAPGGMLLCVPPPDDVALPAATVEAAIGRALARAAAAGVRGPAVTPFLLAAVAEETRGESIAVNVALLRQNARVAAQIARALAV